MPAEEVDGYDNFILLCPDDHTLIDKQPRHYTEAVVRELKRDHEDWVRRLGLVVPEIRIRDPNAGKPSLLHRVDTGAQLMRMLRRSLSSNVQHPDPRSQGEAGLIGDFLQNIHDWLDIWNEIGPGEQVKVEFDVSQQIGQLRQAGLVVYAGLREKVLEGGTARPVPWREAVVSFHRADDPLIASDVQADGLRRGGAV
jgi:hypothetical protein